MDVMCSYSHHKMELLGSDVTMLKCILQVDSDFIRLFLQCVLGSDFTVLFRQCIILGTNFTL